MKEIGGNQCLIVTPLNEDESVDEEPALAGRTPPQKIRSLQ